MFDLSRDDSSSQTDNQLQTISSQPSRLPLSTTPSLRNKTLTSTRYTLELSLCTVGLPMLARVRISQT